MIVVLAHISVVVARVIRFGRFVDRFRLVMSRSVALWLDCVCVVGYRYFDRMVRIGSRGLGLCLWLVFCWLGLV